MPIRHGQRVISLAPCGEIARSLWSNHTFFWVSQRAQGTSSLSNISVCHCSHKVAGAKIATGFTRVILFGIGGFARAILFEDREEFACLAYSGNKHKVSAAVPNESVLPSPTSSASKRRTQP